MKEKFSMRRFFRFLLLQLRLHLPQFLVVALVMLLITPLFYNLARDLYDTEPTVSNAFLRLSTLVAYNTLLVVMLVKLFPEYSKRSSQFNLLTVPVSAKEKFAAKFIMTALLILLFIGIQKTYYNIYNASVPFAAKYDHDPLDFLQVRGPYITSVISFFLVHAILLLTVVVKHRRGTFAAIVTCIVATLVSFLLLMAVMYVVYEFQSLSSNIVDISYVFAPFMIFYMLILYRLCWRLFKGLQILKSTRVKTSKNV